MTPRQQNALAVQPIKVQLQSLIREASLNDEGNFDRYKLAERAKIKLSETYNLFNHLDDFSIQRMMLILVRLGKQPTITVN